MTLFLIIAVSSLPTVLIFTLAEHKTSADHHFQIWFFTLCFFAIMNPTAASFVPASKNVSVQATQYVTDPEGNSTIEPVTFKCQLTSQNDFLLLNSNVGGGIYRETTMILRYEQVNDGDVLKTSPSRVDSRLHFLEHNILNQSRALEIQVRAGIRCCFLVNVW